MSDYLYLMNNLRFITRYSDVERIRDEDVAQHSFMVCTIVMELHDMYDFDLGDSLKIAVTHDMPESITGDISHALKSKYPKLDHVLGEIERDNLKDFPESVKKWIYQFYTDSLEAKIVQLADAIQVLQYTTSELRLGNTGRMKRINEKTIERVNGLKKELEHARKH